MGGWLAYESGWWKDRLKIGLAGYTSQNLYGPEYRDGTILLKSGQEGFSLLGQAYLQTRVSPKIGLTAQYTDQRSVGDALGGIVQHLGSGGSHGVQLAGSDCEFRCQYDGR